MNNRGTMVKRIVIVLLIGSILWNRYTDSTYYQNRVLYDVIMTLEESDLIYTKATIIRPNQSGLTRDIREYTDLEWWKQNGKEVAEYRTEANFEADMIKRKQNNLLFEPIGGLISSLKTLVLNESKNVIDINKDLQIKVELYNTKTVSERSRPYRFNINIYFDQEVISVEGQYIENKKDFPIVLKLDEKTKKLLKLI